MDPLAKIFGSQARLKLLRFFSFNQTANPTIAALEKSTKNYPAVFIKELSIFLEAWYIQKKGSRATTRYQVNPRFEHAAALDHFIRETTSVRPKDILIALKRAGTAQLVVLSGFFVGSVQPQVDLLVVGDRLDERTLASAVHALEADLGREIRYAAFATPDFRYRRGVYDRLLRDIFDYPHRVLIDKLGL
jgi:hypothetical protein